MKQMKKIALGVGLFAFSAFAKPDFNAEFAGKAKSIKPAAISPFQKGESISYLVHYGIVDAGEATLSIKKQDTTIDGNSVLHMVGEGKTLSVFEWFYKVRDVYETYLDEKSLTPRKFVRRVNEGGYIIDRDYHFVPEQGKVHTLRKGTIKTPKDVQDMLSSFYYMRAMDFSSAKPGDIYKINSFMDYKMYPFYVKYVGRDEVKIGLGKFRCLKFVPVVQEGRVFKSEEDLEIWVSDDVNKVPILAKANIIVGSVKAELTSYKNLKAQLPKVDEKGSGLFGWF
jgi:hypothetical protein